MKIDALFLQAKSEKSGILGSGAMNEIWGPSNQQVLNSLLVLVGKTYKKIRSKLGVCWA